MACKQHTPKQSSNIFPSHLFYIFYREQVHSRGVIMIRFSRIPRGDHIKPNRIIIIIVVMMIILKLPPPPPDVMVNQFLLPWLLFFVTRFFINVPGLSNLDGNAENFLSVITSEESAPPPPPPWQTLPPPSISAQETLIAAINLTVFNCAHALHGIDRRARTQTPKSNQVNG